MLRDWPGLAILFIMPAVLLIVITLTQESAIPSKKSGMKVALVDADSAAFGQTVVSDLTGSEYLNFITFNTADEARAALLDGKCQIAVIVPDSSTEKLYNLLNGTLVDSLPEAVFGTDSLPDVVFLYDPAIQRIIKDAVIMPLNSLIQLTAVKVIMTKYTEDVNRKMHEYTSGFSAKLTEKEFLGNIPDFPYRKEVIRRFGEAIDSATKVMPAIQLPFSPSFNSALVMTKEEPARKENHEFRPNLLQNNIPAFTLFAMFFIVIPLAGSIINEKTNGTFNRMRTLPVSYFHVVAAKISVFLAVCILQFIFLMFIGKYIIPALGDQVSLDLDVNIPALLLALITSSLSAIGFGIIVGALADTHGQAATFGSVMVVILALLGGIFMPVHMLPDIIKEISIISPLRWGTDAFLGVFARLGDLGSILPEASLLTGFFLISILIAIIIFRRR